VYGPSAAACGPRLVPRLFGHWWYEGPTFLAKCSAWGGSGAPLHQLGKGCWLRPDRWQICRPSPSSWGQVATTTTAQPSNAALGGAGNGSRASPRHGQRVNSRRGPAARPVALTSAISKSGSCTPGRGGKLAAGPSLPTGAFTSAPAPRTGSWRDRILSLPGPFLAPARLALKTGNRAAQANGWRTRE